MFGVAGIGMLVTIKKKKTMNYIIFDLEATCWDQWGKGQNESIENSS
ncbi:MAG: hypothetical protein ACI8P3_004066 [Saprospiraceae bacterium]|jgi:hypothetical protein